MISSRKVLVCLMIVFMLLAGLNGPQVSGKSSASQGNALERASSRAGRLVAGLEEQGFEVTEGFPRLYTKDDCPASYEEVGTCYANNPAAPYVTFSFLPWPKEFVDPATDQAFGETDPGYSTTYRLDPREAVVILATLPPPARYFGFQTYLFSRQDKFTEHSLPYRFIASFIPERLDIFFKVITQNPKRVMSFSSLSNSINNVVIAEQSGEAFDQDRVFIITPDQIMDAVVRQALIEDSVKDRDIFTEPIPSNMRLGLNQSADEFVTLIRYSMPLDKVLADAWRADLPLQVFRIRDTRPGRKAEPYGPVELEKREVDPEQYLRRDLADLIVEVCERFVGPYGEADCADKAEEFVRAQLPPIDLVGPHCAEIGMNCLGDTQDAVYQVSKVRMIEDDDVYAVVGTLGTETGNATYVGLGLNGSMTQFGFANYTDEDLKGTASYYAPQVDNTDKFFLAYFARSCAGLEGLTNDGGIVNCFEVSEGDLPPCGDPSGLTCDDLLFTIRDYMRPGTRRGPAAIGKLHAWVIDLKRP